jgi:hypothetical protein
MSRSLPEDVHESSGVAVSRQHAGTFWTHNDSGEPYIYIADIGDNDAKRPLITVYRVPEPTPGEAQTRPAEALQASYPDGAHDAEALFVHNGQMYILTKGETGPVALYRFPSSTQPGQTVRLERVREFAGDDVKRKERITGADASPDGRWIAVRTLRDLSLYPTADFLGSGGQVEFLLITSRGRSRWLIPKGGFLPGYGPRHAARTEAYEEAGVDGSMGPKPIGFALVLGILVTGGSLNPPLNSSCGECARGRMSSSWSGVRRSAGSTRSTRPS